MRHHLEVRTTISPTPSFFRRIHYLAASLGRLSGRAADHELVVSVGGDAPRENLYRTQPWSNRYPILWRWVDPSAYAAGGYRATGRDRSWHMARAELVMVADADVLFMDDVDDLLQEIEDAPAICGVMAHVSPFTNRPERAAEEWWSLLGARFGIADLPLEHEHSGWGCVFTEEAFRRAPAYFNGGMIVGPAAQMEEMFSLLPAAEEAVDAVLDSYFRPQLARTLAVYKASIPRRVVPLRYNFPNWDRFEEAYPAELADLRILHYLRRDHVHRDRDFETVESVPRLLARTDLTGADERLRERLAELHERVAEEEAHGVARLRR